MGVFIAQWCIDCIEPRSLAAWWAEVLGWTVDEESAGEADADEVWISEHPGGTTGIYFLRVPEHKVVKNRVHLDVRPTDGSDQDSELRRLLDLGAAPVDIGQGDVAWHVLADPEGNEFCLLRSAPSQLEADA